MKILFENISIVIPVLMLCNNVMGSQYDVVSTNDIDKSKDIMNKYCDNIERNNTIDANCDTQGSTEQINTIDKFKDNDNTNNNILNNITDKYNISWFFDNTGNLLDSITQEEKMAYPILKIWCNGNKISQNTSANELSELLPICCNDLDKIIDNIANTPINNKKIDAGKKLCNVLANITAVIGKLPKIHLITEQEEIYNFNQNYDIVCVNYEPQYRFVIDTHTVFCHYCISVMLNQYTKTKSINKKCLNRIKYYLQYYNNRSIKDILNQSNNRNINYYPSYFDKDLAIKQINKEIATHKLRQLRDHKKANKNNNSFCSIF